MADGNHDRLTFRVRLLQEQLKRAAEEGDQHAKTQLAAQLKEAREALSYADATNSTKHIETP